MRVCDLQAGGQYRDRRANRPRSVTDEMEGGRGVKLRKQRRRYELEVSGWRYTRRLVLGFRWGEWWIGARRNFQCDWWEIGLFGLTVCVPYEKRLRKKPKPPGRIHHVPAGAERCPRCGDINYDPDTLVCITCTYGDDGYADGRFCDGWDTAVKEMA